MSIIHFVHTKTDGTTKHDIEDLDLPIPMHNLVDNSFNYSDTTVIYSFFQKQVVLMLILQTLMLLNLDAKR